MNPVSSSGGAPSLEYQVAVASKALDLSKEEGRQAVSLIQSAEPAAAPAQPQGSLGHHVNVRA
jgi:hypothetical protein